MRAYKLGNSHAKVLDRLVAEGVFKSPEAALRDAVDTYLSGLRQRQQQAGFAIDLYPADDGAYKTQEQWIAFFNEQRKPMISAANLYLAGKSAPDELLKSLRSDFDESLIVSSTRISYSGDDLSGRITQNYGSKVVKPSQTDVSVIPVYDNTPLVKALDSEDGIRYLQSLFDAKDNPKTIAGTLEHLSERKVEDIILWTPNQDLRKRYSERAAWFVIGGVGFHVDGNGRFDDYLGRSRGVSVSPRSGRAKK
nr:hypothetical protein [uncultured archaeon]